MSEAARLDRLIDLVHDAALDPALWPGIASCIAAAFGANSAALHLRDARLAGARALSFTDNYAGADIGAYVRHYAQEDLWTLRAATRAPGTILLSDEVATLAEMERTAWYTDWCRPFEVRHAMGTGVPVGRDSFGIIGIHRAPSLGAFEEADRRLLTAFLPHLRRALQVRERLAALDRERAVGAEVAARSGIATLVADAEARILWANPLAERLLRAPTGLRAPGGRLATAFPAETEALRRLIHRAARSAAGGARDPGGALAIARGEDRLPLTVLVAPFRPAQAGAGGAAPAAILFLRCPEAACSPAMQDALRQLHGLTAAEAAVAAALAEGQSLETIATESGVSLNTVRTQLRAVLAKTGTHRQGELVALLLRGVAGLVRPDG